MPTSTIQIELDGPALDLMRRLTSERVTAAVARGMDRAAALTVSAIQQNRLTGQGPFPADQGKLGVRSGRLRQSLRNVPATINGGTVTAAIGSNVVYAGIHEFGGTIKRTVKAGSVRLRTDRAGKLIGQATNGRLAVFARKTHADSRVKVVAYAGGKNYEIVMPARAPIGHGVADNAETFAREIGRALEEELTAGGPATA